MSLWDALTAGAARGHGTLHCWVDRRFEAAGWDEVVADAERMTAGLRNAGVEPGSRVAAVLTNTPLAVRGILGTWLAGGTLASFPVPSRGMGEEEYAQQLSTLCDHLEPAALLTDASMLAALPEGLRERANARSWESVAGTGRVDPAPPGEDDVAFVQYSSGSTSLPKGCMLTPRAIEAQLALVMDMIDARPGNDRDVSWLPLSHDMGLFGNLLTQWAYRWDLVLSTPERFTFSPRSWFRDVAECEATFTCGTNTGLHFAARAQRGVRDPQPLTKLRVIILGAERLEWDTLSRAVDAFGPLGLRSEMLMPAYGLAEATLAVTATPRLEAPRHVVVDGVALADGEVDEVEDEHRAATRIVSAGVPCLGVELPGLEADRASEIRIRSRCLAQGYYGDEARTRDRFRDGELWTGDLGFERDGHLYPVGRMDDVISIGGRKVYTREIEAAVDALDGIREGCSTIVESRNGGGPRLLLVMEAQGAQRDYRGLAEEAARLAMSKAAVTIDECLFLRKGSVPKTPSGKIQRYRCRQMLDAHRVEPLATVDLAA